MIKDFVKIVKEKRIIPQYAIVPMVSMLILNAVAYFGTRLFTDGMVHFDISGPLDYHMPFLPVFIIPYVLAFFQWIIGYIMIARNGKEYCYKVMGGEMIAKIITGMIFILFPTTMLREEIFGNDIFSRAVALLYEIDAPTNLFPSIHCLESYICMKSALEMKQMDDRYRSGMVIMSLLVFMSTIFIRQHVALDILGAIIVAETGRLLSEFLYSEGLRLFKEKERTI